MKFEHFDVDERKLSVLSPAVLAAKLKLIEKLCDKRKEMIRLVAHEAGATSELDRLARQGISNLCRHEIGLLMREVGHLERGR